MIETCYDFFTCTYFELSTIKRSLLKLVAICVLQLLDEERFHCLEKVKTYGNTYVVAVGLSNDETVMVCLACHMHF